MDSLQNLTGFQQYLVHCSKLVMHGKNLSAFGVSFSFRLMEWHLEHGDF